MQQLAQATLPGLLLLSLLLGGCQQEPATAAAVQSAEPQDAVVPQSPEAAHSGAATKAVLSEPAATGVVVAAPSAEGNAMTEQHKVTVGLDKAELKALYNDIVQMAGKAQADNVAQCRVVGLGAKACGGPQSYLVYSTLNGNESDLLQKVERYNALMRMQNEQLGLLSDCALVVEPALVLVEGVCKAAPNTGSKVELK